MTTRGPISFDHQLDAYTTLTFTFCCNGENEVELYEVIASTKSNPMQRPIINKWRNTWSHAEHRWEDSNSPSRIPPKEIVAQAVSEFQKRIRYIGKHKYKEG